MLPDLKSKLCVSDNQVKIRLQKLLSPPSSFVGLTKIISPVSSPLKQKVFIYFFLILNVVNNEERLSTLYFMYLLICLIDMVSLA